MKRGIQSNLEEIAQTRSQPNKKRRVELNNSEPLINSSSYFSLALNPIVYCKNIITNYFYPNIDNTRPNTVDTSTKIGRNLHTRSTSGEALTNIWNIRDQLQVVKMIEFYESKSLTNDTTQYIGILDKRPIIERQGQFLFQFIEFVVIDKNNINQQTLSDRLESWILDILAFILISKTPVNFKSLKSAIPLNHLQRHWTTLVAEFKINNTFLNTFLELTSHYNEIYNNSDLDPNKISHIQINNTKIFIQDFQNQNKISLLSLFKSIEFTHMDSINSDEIHKIVYQCLNDIISKNESSSYTSIKVARQQGLTCAEHSTLNGYLFALEKASTEKLQQDVDSTKLRESMNQFI